MSARALTIAGLLPLFVGAAVPARAAECPAAVHLMGENEITTRIERQLRLNGSVTVQRELTASACPVPRAWVTEVVDHDRSFIVLVFREEGGEVFERLVHSEAAAVTLLEVWAHRLRQDAPPRPVVLGKPAPSPPRRHLYQVGASFDLMLGLDTPMLGLGTRAKWSLGPLRIGPSLRVAAQSAVNGPRIERSLVELLLETEYSLSLGERWRFEPGVAIGGGVLSRIATDEHDLGLRVELRTPVGLRAGAAIFELVPAVGLLHDIPPVGAVGVAAPEGQASSELAVVFKLSLGLRYDISLPGADVGGDRE